MPVPTHIRLLARFVLVWFAFWIGVSVASPLVHPQGVQWVCSANGVVKVLASGEGGSPIASHTLDCPLCAAIGGPPSVPISLYTDQTPSQPIPIGSTRVWGAYTGGAPFPARGPPTL